MSLFKKAPAETIGVKGEKLLCVCCGGDLFHKRSALLNTSGMTFLDLDWANAEAVCCVCDHCGFVHWFLP